MNPQVNHIVWPPTAGAPRTASSASIGSLKLMETHAQHHWRAAAWLLERQNPEEYARKPVNSTNPKRVDAALRFMQEAALANAPEELRPALYQALQAAASVAFDHCFPAIGPWGRPARGPLPFETPFSDRQDEAAHVDAIVAAVEATALAATQREAGSPHVEPAAPPAAESAANGSPLSPKIDEATELAVAPPAALNGDQATLSPTTRQATRGIAPTPVQSAGSAPAVGLLSPKIDEATKVDDDVDLDAPVEMLSRREKRRRERSQRAAAKQARRAERRAEHHRRAA
jgi:hypothetical protein